MNNEVQELGIMTTTDVTAITPKVIANVIEEIARDKVIWAQFYKVNTDLMRNGGTEVVFPKKNSGIVASWGVSAGTGLTASAMSFSAVTIPVIKGGVGIGIYGEAIRQSNRDVISDNLKEAGEVWASTTDVVAWEAMFPSTTATACNNGTFVAASISVLGIKAVNPTTLTGFTIVNLGTSSSITYATDVVGTITYWYTPSTCGYRGASAGASSLTAKDIINVKSAIGNYKYKPKVLVVNSERLTDLLYDANAKFLESGRDHVYNGELGQLWGLKVVVNCYCSTFAAVMIDPDALGYQVVRKNLDMKRDEYTGMSMDCLYFWGFAEKGFGVVNARAYGAIAVKGTYAVASGLGTGYP